MRKVMAFVILGTLVLFTGTAFAASLPSPDVDLNGFVTAVFNAFAQHDYKVVAAAVILAAVWGIRKYGSRVWPALESSKAAVYTSWVVGAVLAVAGYLMDGGAVAVVPLIKVLIGGLVTAITASGMFSQAKTLQEKPE